MNASTPLPALSRKLRRLIAEGTAVRPMTAVERDQLWREVNRRIERPPRSWWRPAWAVAAAAAALVGLVWIVRTPPSAVGPATVATKSPAGARLLPRPQARVVRLGNRADLELRSDAEVALPPGSDANQRGPYRVRLTRGQLSAAVGHREADEPLVVETPHLAVVVVGTRFSVEVAGSLTSVSVEEGRVRIERGGHTVMLAAGEAIRSDDPRLNDAHSALACSDAPDLDARRACLRHVADGQGLAAENALLALGLLERQPGEQPARAIALFREHQRRFPSGVLVPEVALALTTVLAAQSQHEQACAEADAFARRFPRDRTTHERLARICGR